MHQIVYTVVFFNRETHWQTNDIRQRIGTGSVLSTVSVACGIFVERQQMLNGLDVRAAPCHPLAVRVLCCGGISVFDMQLYCFRSYNREFVAPKEATVTRLGSWVRTYRHTNMLQFGDYSSWCSASTFLCDDG